MNKRIIAVVGMPGAGKSTVVKMLTQQYSLPSIYFGNLTLEEVRKRGLPETQESEKVVRQELREKHGMGAYAYLSLSHIENLFKNADTIIIDGLYSWSEYTFLKNADLAVTLLLILCKKENRYRRLASRNIRPLKPEEAEQRDIAEIVNLEKGGPIAMCDYYITNDNSAKQLDIEVEKFAKEFMLSLH